MAEDKHKSYLVLARKWRPQRFEDVVGQRAISETLKRSIASGRIANAYLFSGQRGVGKTSIARIFAKALNCERGPTPEPCGKCARCLSITAGADLDVIEIDGATYTRVDDVRVLQEGISHLPYAARYKVYIIDEVHMLSTAAFNALLKTLEEPPPKVVFIFATTEPEKIPETIKSRCQQFSFEPVSAEDLTHHLERIIESENISLKEEERSEIIEAIVRTAEGSVRDALVTLEQLTVLGDGEIKLEFCRQLLGLVESLVLVQTLTFILQKNTAGLLNLVNELVRQGRDLQKFIRSFIYFLRDLLLVKAGADAQLLGISHERIEQLRNLVKDTGYPFLLNLMNTFLRLEEEMKTSGLPRFVLEFHLIKLTAIEPAVDLDRFIKKLESGSIPEPAKPRADSIKPSQFNPAGDGIKQEFFSTDTTDVTISTSTTTESPASQKTQEQLHQSEYSEPVKEFLSIDNKEQIWQKLCRMIGKKNPPLEESMKDCCLLGFNDSSIIIGVLNNQHSTFNMNLLQKNLSLISSVLEKNVGKNYAVQLKKVEVPEEKKIPVHKEEISPKSESDTTESFTEDSTIPEEIPVENGKNEEESIEKELLEIISSPLIEESADDIEGLLQQNPDLKTAVDQVVNIFKGKIVQPKKKK